MKKSQSSSAASIQPIESSFRNEFQDNYDNDKESNTQDIPSMGGIQPTSPSSSSPEGIPQMTQYVGWDETSSVCASPSMPPTPSLRFHDSRSDLRANVDELRANVEVGGGGGGGGGGEGAHPLRQSCFSAIGGSGNKSSSSSSSSSSSVSFAANTKENISGRNGSSGKLSRSRSRRKGQQLREKTQCISTFSPGQQIAQAAQKRRRTRTKLSLPLSSRSEDKRSSIDTVATDSSVVNGRRTSIKGGSEIICPQTVVKPKKSVLDLTPATCPTTSSSVKKPNPAFEAAIRGIQDDIYVTNLCADHSEGSSLKPYISPTVVRKTGRLKEEDKETSYSLKSYFSPNVRNVAQKNSPKPTATMSSNKKESLSPFSSGMMFDDNIFAHMDALVQDRHGLSQQAHDGDSKQGKEIAQPVEEDPFGHLPDISMDLETLDKHISASTCDKSSLYNQNKSSSFSRFVVCDVSDDSFTWTKTLSVRPFHDEVGRKASSYIYLRGMWYDSDVSKGDVVHVVSVNGCSDITYAALPLVIDSSTEDDLLFVTNPDLFLSPSIISDATTCVRRAVLRKRMGSSSLSNRNAVYGRMRHDLFECCLKHEKVSNDFVAVTAQNIIRTHAEELISCGVTDADAMFELKVSVPQIRHFFNSFTNFINNNHVCGNTNTMISNAQVGISIKKTFATEHEIVVPEIGLTGRIDAVVEAKIAGDKTNMESMSVARLPLELKTGSRQTVQVQDAAQLSLYSMMMNFRDISYFSTGNQDEIASGGLLLYLNGKGLNTSYIPSPMHHVKALVSNRNSVASHWTRVSQPRGVVFNNVFHNEDEHSPTGDIEALTSSPACLPKCSVNINDCYRCYSNKECSLYAKSDIVHALELGKDPNPSLTAERDNNRLEIINKVTSHLSKEEIRFFIDWDRMIDLEAFEAYQNVVQSWLVTSIEQEKNTGLCVSAVEWDKEHTDPAYPRDGWHTEIKFFRPNSLFVNQKISSLKIHVSDNIIVSTDTGKYGIDGHFYEGNPRGRKMYILRGRVTNILDTSICLLVSKGDIKQLSEFTEIVGYGKVCRFRLDKNDNAFGTGGLRQNLVNLLIGDISRPSQSNNAEYVVASMRKEIPSLLSARMPKLRDLIIKLKPPSFLPMKAGKSIFCGDYFPNSKGRGNFEGCKLNHLLVEFQTLNSDQQNAIHKVMVSKDYTIIQGMPGTGKTSVISFACRLLVAHGKRVLITSYTNSAVDNLMIKLGEANVEPGVLLRVDNGLSAHSSVTDILVSTVAKKFEVDPSQKDPTSQSLKRALAESRIVGITALKASRSPLLFGQHFDVVFCDEAGQITQPAMFGPLMCADTFVLVGDHKQLPPTVRSEAAIKGGYAVSLMEKFAEAHPQSCVQLTLQYRMHGNIAELCNKIMYNGALKSANNEVDTKALSLPNFEHLKSLANQNRWLPYIINPAQPVVFVDTDTAMETRFVCEGISKVRDGNKFVSPPQQISLEASIGRNGSGGNIINSFEVDIVEQVVVYLLQCGAQPIDIGLITPYRSQVRKLCENEFLHDAKDKGVEISTIDSYQGRDKKIVIISFVRSNTKGKAGRLLNDSRRINVAISRAKRKLILIGSCKTLKNGSEVLLPMLDLIEEKQWLFRLNKA